MITHQTSSTTSSPDSEGPRLNGRRFVFSALRDQAIFTRAIIIILIIISEMPTDGLLLIWHFLLSLSLSLSPALSLWIFLPLSSYYSACIHHAVTLTPGEVWKSHNKNAKCQECRRNLRGEEWRNSRMLFYYSAQIFSQHLQREYDISATMWGYIQSYFFYSALKVHFNLRSRPPVSIC